MKKPKVKQIINHSTEEKIKNAARLMFHTKGYAATKTRDIAEEAGINLALLNYYFRSKEKLFELVMSESLMRFMKTILEVFNNETTSLDTKIEKLADNYIDVLTDQPDIPLFVLSEIRNDSEKFISKLNAKEGLMSSYFIKQFQQAVKEERIAPIHPLHFIMNLMGLVVFPFVASPILKSLGNMKQEDFNNMMQQRKTMIPKWINAILKVK